LWHEIATSLTHADNYGGYGRNFGTASTIGTGRGEWNSGGWNGAAWGGGGGWGGWGHPGGAVVPLAKTPQKKKKRKARERARLALWAAMQEEMRQEEQREMFGYYQTLHNYTDYSPFVSAECTRS
jgi:hypothetical protein